MLTATVTITTTSTSLRNLINTALPNKLPVGFWGRAYQVILLPSAATVFAADAEGIAFAGAGNAKAALAGTPTQTVFLSPTGNQVALEEICLFSTAGAETVSVIVLTL